MGFTSTQEKHIILYSVLKLPSVVSRQFLKDYAISGQKKRQYELCYFQDVSKRFKNIQ